VNLRFDIQSREYVGHCRPAEQPLPRWRRAMVVAGSQCPRAMLLALGFWVRYRGWENVEEGRKQHAVRGLAAS